MTQDLTLVTTLAAALRDAPGEAGRARGLELLAASGLQAVVTDGRVRVAGDADPALRDAIEAVFALGGSALEGDELVATGRLTTLGSLASSVVHELNNPLFAILGLVEFLLRDAEPGSKAHARLELVQTTGLEMKDVARALLDFAREEPARIEPVDLADTVDNVAQLFRLTAAAKGVEIAVRAEPQPLHVLGRRNELRQLLLALFLNGKQALPNGGTIAVELSRDGNDALLRVRDAGPGIPPELGERAFDAFVTTRAKQGALGLGLTVARTIARRHGGDLVLEPSAEGASLVARLPLVPGGAS